MVMIKVVGEGVEYVECEFKFKLLKNSRLRRKCESLTPMHLIAKIGNKQGGGKQKSAFAGCDIVI